MRSVNNKIAKPIISIGFNKKGHVTFNVNLNKTNKLNEENMHQVKLTLTTIKRILSGEVSVPENGDMSNVIHQPLAIFNDYKIITNMSFHNIVTLDQLMEVEVFMKNNKKLGAVKRFKEFAGCGLKDAKDFIDWYGTKKNYRFVYPK